jgi:hypothetical protein
MKVSRYIAVVLLSVVLFRTDALAAPVLFDVTGLFEDGSTLSGTVTIDTALGTVTAADVTLGAPISLELTGVLAIGVVGNSLDVAIGSHKYPSFQMFLPVTTLVGFTGSDMCSQVVQCSQVANFYFGNGHRDLHDGSIALASDLSEVPEPASLVLLGSGLLGMTARWQAARRRRLA